MGISRTTSDSARIAGALAGAGLFAAFGIAPAYAVITGIYLAGALLTLGVEPRRPADAHPDQVVAGASGSLSPWGDFREGIVHIWNTPSLLAVVWLAFLFNFSAFSITQGLLPYVAKDVYHVDQTGLGYLVASLSLGAVLGSLALSWTRIEIRLPRLMIVAAIVWHGLLLVFAQTQSLAGGIVTLLLVGVVQSLSMVSHTVILLRAANQKLRGRVMGVRMLAIYSLPLGLLAAGVLVDRVGFGATASLYAIIGLVFTILIGVRWRASLWKPQLPRHGP